MAPPTGDVKNWINMFRWIVKLIRDEYEVDETVLTRTAVLETDCGLVIRWKSSSLLIPKVCSSDFQWGRLMRSRD
jgi:hypothetical protein